MSKFKFGDMVRVADKVDIEKYEDSSLGWVYTMYYQIGFMYTVIGESTHGGIKLDSGYHWYEEDLTLVESSQNA